MHEMDKMLEMQFELMTKVPHNLPPEKVVQLVTGKGIIEETLEYLNSIGSKPWRPNPLSREAQLEEITDILFFYLELIHQSGFSWDDIVIEYARKHAINLKRYSDGAKGDYSWDDKGEKEEL